MTFVVDASYGHAKITPKALKKIGAQGAVLYAGCYDTAKCCTKAELHALLDAGYLVGLVIENSARDMLNGYSLGVTYGRNLAAAANRLGYDLAHCVGYTAADWDVTGSQLDEVDAFMTGFRTEIPVPGVYGDRGVLDYVAGKGHAVGYWQTNAMSWSGGVTSSRAQLQQRFNDPRAHGLPVDVNDVLRTPLYLMGEDRTPAHTPDPEGGDEMATIYRPSGAYHYPVLVDGATRIVITKTATVTALLKAGARQVIVAPDDYNRIRKGATL